MTIRVATPADLDDAISQIEAAARVYIDTEFHAERRYHPRLYLVQVHVDDGDTWLLDPLIGGILEAVAPALRVTPWVVHAGRQDLRLLQRALGGIPDDVLDTQIGAGLAGSRFPQSYGKLIQQFLNRELDKSATLSDWSRRPLSDEQIRYAAADVQLLPSLWGGIQTALETLGRLPVCREACAEARENALDPDRDIEQWRRIQAAAVMAGPNVCTLHALALWREDKARTSDQPVRSVLSDGLMVELSKRLPLTVETLRANRRFPKGIVKRHGEEILEVVSRASTRPEWAWPAIIRHRTPQARQLAWFRAFALIEEESHYLAAHLVLPERMLERIILAEPADRSALAEVVGPWRDRLCGERIWEALQGRTAMQLAGSNVEVVPVCKAP